MKISRFIANAVAAAAFSIGLGSMAAQAQITEQQPAEFPPRSYTGKQYVDSKGCVFIRAGIDGDVSWVPRVNRQRQIICGYKPSGLTGVVAAPAAPAAEAAPRITLNPPAEVTPSPRPVPAPVTPAPKPLKAAAAQRRVTSKPVIRKAPVERTLTEAVAVPVQPVAPTSGVAQRGRGGEVAITAQTRILPKHVAIQRLNTRNVVVPQGYRRVWDDDRLNPRRAEQNLAGRADMLLIWTQSVPRRLINQANGRDVTATVPLVYPYLDLATQRRELGTVEIVRRDGKVVKRVIRNKPRAIYSSRSKNRVEETRPAPAAQDPRFVQVGSFRDPGNARRSARRIAAMGLPARIGQKSRGGLMVVQAGPFPGSDALQAALVNLRRAGYKDAFARP
ncbi:SPOR domain-containing protein [Sulfitobacter aestuarii]|uniref:SPOR domain-containing protein n=1 Tax=Sulfitobacter aestuarii TaxID=2161676 RepID=A0ABW5U4T8_9RHOB